MTATTPRFADLEQQAQPDQKPAERSDLPAGVRFHQEDRREVRYWLSIACAYILSWIAYLLPKSIRYRIADLGGDFFFLVAPGYRRNVTANLAQVLGPNVEPAAMKHAVRTVFRTSGRNFADLLVVPRCHAEAFNRSTSVRQGSFRLLDEALTDGRGALVLTGHVGAFDIMGQVLRERGYKLTVVTVRTTSRFVFDAVSYLRSSRGMNLVEASPSGVRKAIQALRRGEVAVLVSDRDFFHSGRPMRLFGRETTLPVGIVRIARDTGAPIVPIFGQRAPEGHVLTIEPGFRVPKTNDLESDVDLGLANVVDSIERAINRTPDQWVIFQRVWPSEVAAPAPAAPAG